MNISSVTIYAKDSKITSNELTERTETPTHVMQTLHHKRALTECETIDKGDRWPAFNIRKRSVRVTYKDHRRKKDEGKDT